MVLGHRRVTPEAAVRTVPIDEEVSANRGGSRSAVARRGLPVARRARRRHRKPFAADTATVVHDRLGRHPTMPLYELTLTTLLAVGALVAAGVLGVAVAALHRRPSWPYLLVALALGTLFVRFVAGVVYVRGSVSPETHHLLEHGLDVAMAALVIGAVLVARETASRRGEPG